MIQNERHSPETYLLSDREAPVAAKQCMQCLSDSEDSDVRSFAVDGWAGADDADEAEKRSVDTYPEQ